jgi:hypothetical protein
MGGGRHSRAIALQHARDENIYMVAKVLLIGGGFLVGLVCLGLFTIAMFYLAYCAVAGHREKLRDSDTNRGVYYKGY